MGDPVGKGAPVAVAVLVPKAMGEAVGRAVGRVGGCVGGGWVGSCVGGGWVGRRVGTVCREAVCPGVAQTPGALTSVKITNPNIKTATSDLFGAVFLSDIEPPPMCLQRR